MYFLRIKLISPSFYASLSSVLSLCTEEFPWPKSRWHMVFNMVILSYSDRDQLWPTLISDTGTRLVFFDKMSHLIIITEHKDKYFIPISQMKNLRLKDIKLLTWKYTPYKWYGNWLFLHVFYITEDIKATVGDLTQIGNPTALCPTSTSEPIHSTFLPIIVDKISMLLSKANISICMLNFTSFYLPRNNSTEIGPPTLSIYFLLTVVSFSLCKCYYYSHLITQLLVNFQPISCYLLLQNSSKNMPVLLSHILS